METIYLAQIVEQWLREHETLFALDWPQQSLDVQDVLENSLIPSSMEALYKKRNVTLDGNERCGVAQAYQS